MKIAFLLAIISLLSVQISFAVESFCGTSTLATCSSNSDCASGGCSNQVCAGSWENITTTCEFRSCYAAENYSLSCQCINSKCQWGDQNSQPFSTITTNQSSVMNILASAYDFLASFNPIVLLILGVILILAAKLSKFVGIILIILALIGFLLLFLH